MKIKKGKEIKGGKEEGELRYRRREKVVPTRKNSNRRLFGNGIRCIHPRVI